MRYSLNAEIIKESIQPDEFYLREQHLDRFGYKSGRWAVAGLCPFHDDSKAGSFKVNLQSGAFKCWSCGATGGDIICFLQQRDDIDFVAALQQLVNEWGVRTC